MAPDTLPQLDPADAALLLSPEQLRNPGAKNANVSFLRRTQYISSGGGGTSSPAFRLPPSKSKVPKAAAPISQAQKEEPMYIKRYIQKGFDVAYPEDKHTGPETDASIRGLPATAQEIEEWNNPVHPDNPRLKVVETLPFLPDLEAFTDAPGYATFKFDKAPLPAIGGKRDARIDVGLLHPTNPSARVRQAHEERKIAHERNPAVNPDPGDVPLDWDLCLPETTEVIAKIKATLNTSRSHRDDDRLYTEEDEENTNKFFRFPRLRSYETAHQVLEQLTLRSVALSLYDPNSRGETSHLSTGPSAAYYYPISQKTKLRPERKPIAQGGFGLPRREEIPEDRADQIKLAVREPDAEEIQLREDSRLQVDSKLRDSIQDAEGDVQMDDGGAPGGPENGGYQA